MNAVKYNGFPGESFEMFGNKIDDEEALGIFDFEVQRDKDRTNANVLYSSNQRRGMTVVQDPKLKYRRSS